MKNIENKKNIVLKLRKIFNDVLSLILIDPFKLNSNQLTYIRKISKENKFNLIMIKNSLLKKIFLDTKFEILNNEIYGPNIIIYFNSDVIFIIKKIQYIINNIGYGEIKLVFTENKIFYKDKINYLYTLNSYEDSIKKFILVINEISINKLLKILYFLKNINKKGK